MAEEETVSDSSAIERLQLLMAQPATLTSYDWLLIATEVVRLHKEADRSPMIDNLLDELREITAGFTNPDFLAASKAARRQAPALFQ